MSDELSDADRRVAEILRRAVPDGPDPLGRADEVVRRGRRANRGRAGVSVLAVGAVAAVVLVAPGLLEASGPSDDTASVGPTTPPSSGPVTGSMPYTCPRPGESQRSATVPPSDDVPPGAVLARICPLRGPQFLRWLPPREALTRHVDRVAQAYNFLPKGEPLPCPIIRGIRTGFSVTFQYPDGHLVRVNAATDGYGSCDFISVDGRDDLGRARSAVVVRAYFEALQRQSPDQAPPPVVTKTHLTCPSAPEAQARPLVGTRLDLAAVTICQYPGMIHQISESDALTAAEVAAVNANYSSAMTSHPPAVTCPLGPSHPIFMMGADDWGRQVWMAFGCGFFQAAHHYWLPDAAVRGILGSL